MAKQLNLTVKFSELRRLLDNSPQRVLVMCPHILGDNYEELARNMLAVSEAGKMIHFTGPEECSVCSKFEREEKNPFSN